MKKLKSFVLKLPQAMTTPELNPFGIPGTEVIARSSPQLDGIKVETRELEDGERAEVATEKDTLAVGISMPFTLIQPMDAGATPASGGSWGIDAIDADGLDENAGAGVKVAVLDTGIAKDHEAFDGLDPICENFIEGEPDEDTHGHGSHCAGTIFGQDVGSRRIGVARGVRKPLIGKVLGTRGGSSQQIMDGIFWAQRKGAQIISMSLGMDFTQVQADLQNAGYYQREATSLALRGYAENLKAFELIAGLFADNPVMNSPLLIAAAGNESDRDNYTIATAPPAAADDIVSVGATDQNGDIARFSNTFPDCAAPGVGILSVDHTGGLKAISGTSMAAPHVAGVAVLEAAKLAQIGPFTAAQLRQELLARAQPSPRLSLVDGGKGIVKIALP